MAVSTLNSKIRLCKGINLDRNYVNVVNYTEQQMLALCESQAHLVASADTYSFIRNKGSIQTKFSYSDALNSNYIAFQNPDYANKWFFAFIDEVIYLGEYNTEIKYTVDVWSTWFNKITTKSCLVLREHVNDDTVGKNTVPENLDIGDVIEVTKEDIDLSVYTELSQRNFYYIIMTTYDPVLGDFVGVNRVNSNIFGCKIFAFSGTAVGSTYLENFIKKTNNDSKLDSIQALFIAPAKLIESIGITRREGYIGPGQSGYYEFYEISESAGAYTLNHTFFRPTPVIYESLGINIKNNKLLCYPYCYMLISNNNGNQNIYRYEDFNLTDTPANNDKLELQMSLTIGCSGRIVPKNYKGIEYNYDEAIPVAKYPTCAWASDAFINWITKNGVDIASSVGLGLAGTVLGVATGGVGFAVAGLSVAGTVANLIGQFRKADLLPSITGGNNTGDVNFSTLATNKISIYCMRVKDEYLHIIDDYFTRFGYKINRVKVPNITGRTYWNYVEIGASEEIGYGDVPSKEMEIINNACRKGVTIWHNHDNVGNYSLNNTIVTP